MPSNRFSKSGIDAEQERIFHVSEKCGYCLKFLYEHTRHLDRIRVEYQKRRFWVPWFLPHEKVPGSVEVVWEVALD